MAGFESGSSYSFNDSGLLLAHWSETGKLKIWDTSTGTLKQEYTKNFHLTSPCTCLCWIQISKRITPKKKKLKSSAPNPEDSRELIVLGTTLGNILLYDLATNDVIHELEGHTNKVNSLSWSSTSSLFSCSDDKSIIEWDVENPKIKSKWKTGNESMNCLLALSNGKELLSACYSIKLWDLEKKQVIKTFVGHATEVTYLVEMHGHENYFVSSAKGDRVLSAWLLSSKEKNISAASFILKDAPTSVHMQNLGPDSPSMLCAVTESGSVQIFKHKLNGNISKPLKAITNITVASESSNSKYSHPLLIYAILPLNNGNFIIAYGTPVFLLFETISFNDIKEENLVLVRKDKRKMTTSEFNNKVKVPDLNESTEYEVPGSSALKRNRKKKLDVDVPLEERLENLALVNTLSTDGPKKDNMAQLLVQGLQSKDRTILENIFQKTDEAVINSTVKNLPVQALVPLLRELTTMLRGKTFRSRTAVRWLSSVFRLHSAVLLSNPELENIFEPILSCVETRLSLFPALLRLKGRISLVTDQIETNNSEEVEPQCEPLISYQEQDSSDDGEIDLPSEGSDSDENWDEFSEMEDQDEDIDEK